MDALVACGTSCASINIFKEDLFMMFFKKYEIRKSRIIPFVTITQKHTIFILI